jgi:hypothetical protein
VRGEGERFFLTLTQGGALLDLVLEGAALLKIRNPDET